MPCIQVRFSSLLQNVKVTQFYMCNTVMHRIHREVETASKKSSCMLYAAWKSARRCVVNHLFKTTEECHCLNSMTINLNPLQIQLYRQFLLWNIILKGGEGNETVFLPLRLWYKNAASPSQRLYIVCNPTDTVCARVLLIDMS